MPLAWTRVTRHLLKASEVRPGCALSHRFEIGGVLGTLTTIVIWAEPDAQGRVTAHLEASVVLGDRDPLDVADALAKGWAV